MVQWWDFLNDVSTLVYEAMELAGDAKKLLESQWQNSNRNWAGNEEAVGEKVQYVIKHHDHIIYIDKVGGSNTCQKDDSIMKGG